jgi:hypothetical protein
MMMMMMMKEFHNAVVFVLRIATQNGFAKGITKDREHFVKGNWFLL